MADRDGGLVYNAGSLKLGEYLKHWLETYVKGTVRQSTYEVYGYMIHSP